MSHGQNNAKKYRNKCRTLKFHELFNISKYKETRKKINPIFNICHDHNNDLQILKINLQIIANYYL